MIKGLKRARERSLHERVIHMVIVLARTAHNSRFGVSVILFLALCMPGIGISFGQAQVPPTPITSSGLNTEVSGPMNLPGGRVQYDITGGTRVGANLFHSFGEFGVPTNNIGNFLNTTPNLPTTNVLGRVTGGNASNIFGTIQATGFGNANLFLMNPAGLLFGPTATVNVGGMATFTTADYLRLADGNLFHATPTPAADALLSTASVAAFGFLGSNPGAITVQGSQLSVSAGQGIELIGGNITVQSETLADGTNQAAQLSARGGRIHLASAASPGEVLSSTLDYAPNINGQSFGTLGTIQISQKSGIDASGDGGGTVLIRGGRFVLDNSTVSANTTGPAVGPLLGQPGAGIDIQVSQDVVIKNTGVLETNVSPNVAPGIGSGGVRVTADRIEILGIPDFETPPFTGIRSTVASGSTGGNSGDVRLTANSIVVKDFGQILTATEGAGNAGHIVLKANENLAIDGGVVGSESGGVSSASGPDVLIAGNSGNIALTSTHGNISVTNGGGVTSQTINTSGNTGKITASAPEGNIVLDQGGTVFTATRGTGAAGQINITAKNIQLLNQSGISDDNFGPMKPGGITVTASNDLTLAGGSTIATASRSRLGAPAADLNITAKNILITQASQLTSDTFRSGPGGRLNLFADTLHLADGGQIRSGSTMAPRIGPPGQPPPPIPTGPGGTITLQGLAGLDASVLIDGVDSGIFTDTVGTGTGGAINLSARSLTIQNGGTISAETSGITSSAIGGSITVKATDHVTITSGASITASSKAPANAGTISINAGQQLDIIGNSSIKTEAKQARGGNIDIQAIDRVRLVDSSISTSVFGGAGSGGHIMIDPNVVVLQNGQIFAKAVHGNGGDITITTPLFLKDPTSHVDASTPFGLNGTVTIQSPTSNLSESLGTLPSDPSQAHSLVTQRCAALAYGQTSSFVVAGREQLPADPGGWLTSPLAFAALGESLDAGHAVASAPTVMAMAAHNRGTVLLRRLTPAGFLVASFADSEATECHS
jgi:filamentous hemagglutinin family protein